MEDWVPKCAASELINLNCNTNYAMVNNDGSGFVFVAWADKVVIAEWGLLKCLLTDFFSTSTIMPLT